MIVPQTLQNRDGESGRSLLRYMCRHAITGAYLAISPLFEPLADLGSDHAREASPRRLRARAIALGGAYALAPQW